MKLSKQVCAPKKRDGCGNAHLFPVTLHAEAEA